MEKLDFGTKLIEVRKAKGLTQEEVAEKCKITVRTIQRIESGLVNPRAFTIKTITDVLGFEFFETSNTIYEVNKESQNPIFEKQSFLWYLKDLFNLKTNAMKKISILSTSTFLIVFLCFCIINAKAQPNHQRTQKCLTIQRNEDKTVKRVEAVFTQNLNLDSLVTIKKDLEKIGINLFYKKIEFDVLNSLTSIVCEVICNDGFIGTFEAVDMGRKNERVGFYRDYTPNCTIPFATGHLNIK